MTLLTERRLSLTAISKRENLNVSTVWRWAQRGVRGVKLETFNVGGRRWTTEEAFARFVEGTTAAVNGEASSAQSRTNRQRAASISRAEKSLDEDGF